jgi:hypothetical protein
MRTSETNPADWFMLADDRLKVADASYEGAGSRREFGGHDQP